MFASKKNKSLRFRVNKWRLNAITERELYFICCMDEWPDSLEQAALGSQVSLTSKANGEYLQVEVEETDGYKTASSLNPGLWSFMSIFFR